jgi:hypothetical protein
MVINLSCANYGEKKYFDSSYFLTTSSGEHARATAVSLIEQGLPEQENVKQIFIVKERIA